jgi:hypothetical protein
MHFLPDVASRNILNSFSSIFPPSYHNRAANTVFEHYRSLIAGSRSESVSNTRLQLITILLA